MDKIKINLDRTKLSSEYIQTKQNFNHITSQVHAKSSFFKSTWFYGGIGLASVAGILFIALNTQTKKTDETKITLENSQIATNIAPLSQANLTSNDVVLQATSFEPKKSVSRVKYLKTKLIGRTEAQLQADRSPQNVSTATFIPEREIKTIETKKATLPAKNRFPNIQGFYSGELPCEKLCSSGIEVNEDIQILSFKIQYETVRGDNSMLIQGDKIPSKICNDISEFGVDQMVFLTEIYGKDSEGKILNFTPMNFTCLVKN